MPEKSALPAAAALPEVDGVPALSLTWPSPTLVKEGQTENSLGLKAHMKKDFPSAIQHYVAALRKDPANVLARYNLACAFALSGDGARALGLLGQLRAAGCVWCLKKLVKARTDADFDSLRNDERFVAVVAGVEVREPDYARIAAETVMALSEETFAPFQRALDAGLFVTIDGVTEDMSGESDGIKSHRVIATSADLQKVAKEYRVNEYEARNNFGGGDVKGCKDGCCTFADYNCYGTLDVSCHIQKMCLWPTTADTAVPVSLQYFQCGGH